MRTHVTPLGPLVGSMSPVYAAIPERLTTNKRNCEIAWENWLMFREQLRWRRTTLGNGPDVREGLRLGGIV